jgi:hypothetical protein
MELAETPIFEVNHGIKVFVIRFPAKLENRKKVFDFSLMG